MRPGREREPVIWLRTLGATAAGRCAGGAEEAPAPLGVKALGMIAYLAEHAPRPVTRETLVDLLWERVEPTQGKGSLRQEIRRIKKALGEATFEAAFSVTDSHLALVEDAIRYDVAAMEAAAAGDGPEAGAALLDLYGGEFLVDNMPRAERFREWAHLRREYYMDAAIAGFTRLARLDLEGGRVERAQKAADRIVHLDPLHEPGQEILIRCHLANGRRGQARATFERFRGLMLRELGAEPQQELADLVSPRATAAATATAATAAAGGEAAKANSRDRAAEARDAAAKERAARKTLETIVGASRPMIAVLNVSGQNGDDRGGDRAYLASGVVEQLVSHLSRSGWISVAALNSGPFLPAAAGVEYAQRDLRDYADYILRVDVRAEDGRVAITATLNRVADNATIFSDRMEDELKDLLAFQRRIALRIASIFEPVVLDDQSGQEASEEWDEPVDLNHWRLLMRARWLFWTTRPKNNLEARRLLTKALRINSRDVPTHCTMAFSHMLDAWCDWSDDVNASVRDARIWAQKAVSIAPNDAWAQFTLGVMCSTHTTLDQALSRMKQALRLSPALVVALGDLGRVHMFRGETEDATRCAEEALALSPYDNQAGLWIRTQSFAAWVEGDHAAALDLIDYALVIRPAWFQNHYLRAAILAEQGTLGAARDAYHEGSRLIGAYSDASLRIGHPFAQDGLFRRFAAALNKAGGSFAD